MRFYLKQLPSGRVYLSQIVPTKDEVVLDEIDADSWIRARERVPDQYYEQRWGHGFFN